MAGPIAVAQRRKRKHQDIDLQETPKRRTLQACSPCRRRKVGCNGARPYCKNCLRFKDECKYPGNYEESQEASASQKPIETVIDERQRHVLLDLFFSIPHLDFLRQSIYRPTFEATGNHSKFLLTSIYCLSAVYISNEDVIENFNGENAMVLSARLALIAQRYSRESSDQPSVPSTQANLILGYRELICRTGYKSWMYTGLAIRMSQALRLGREYHQKHSMREQEIRRRTLWTCFIMDRLVSYVCARPQTLRSIKLRCLLPCPESDFGFEDSSSTTDTLESGPSPGCKEVLPYFIKAVEHWGLMMDIFASGVTAGPPLQRPTDCSGQFWAAENALKAWISTLPPRMQWSMKTYRAHREISQKQASMFVSLHFILNHALCLAHQEYLPEYEGDTTFDEPNSPDPSSYRHVIKTCLHHAEEITRMASSLSSGDETDRQILQAPFVGVALESAACCHLWTIHRSVQSSPDGSPAHNHITNQELTLIRNILKSWETLWPIAGAWGETIKLLSKLYDAADPRKILDFDATRKDDGEEQQPNDDSISLGSGFPTPQTLKSQRMFDNVRLIIMTVADASGLRHHQIRLHIENLWNQLFLQCQASPRVNGEDTRNFNFATSTAFENIPNFRDMLDFIDDSQGVPYDFFATSSLLAADPQNFSPFP